MFQTLLVFLGESKKIIVSCKYDFVRRLLTKLRFKSQYYLKSMGPPYFSATIFWLLTEIGSVSHKTWLNENHLK